MNIFIVKTIRNKQLTNYITKKNSITNNENVLNIKKNFLRNIILQMCLEAIAIILKIMYIRNMVIESSITQIT